MSGILLFPFLLSLTEPKCCGSTKTVERFILTTWHENIPQRQREHDIPQQILFLGINPLLTWHVCHVRANSIAFVLSNPSSHFWAFPLEISEANSFENKPEGFFRSLILEPDALLIYYLSVKVHYVTEKNTTFTWAVLMERWWQSIAKRLSTFLFFLYY